MSGSESQPSEHDHVGQVLEKFRSAGGRVTAARRVIVETLLGGAEHEHLSAEQLAARVQRSHPELAVSTVYRSLDALEELGVVEHVHVGHGPMVYHLTGQDHVHLICKKCGLITEMPDSTLRAVSDEIRSRQGFTIEPRHFAINGTCQSCT